MASAHDPRTGRPGARPARASACAVAMGCMLAAAVALAAVAGPGRAAGIGELQQRTSDAQSRIRAISAELQQGQAAYDAAKREAAAAARRERALSALLADGERRSAELRHRLEAAERRLEVERRRLKRALAGLAARLVAMYENGVPDTSELVLGSTDYADIATTAEYVRSIQEADVRLAARVRRVRDAMHRQAVRTAALKDRVDAHNARLAEARRSIGAVREKEESSAARLASINSERQGKIGQLRDDIDEWAAQIQAARKASREQAEEEVARQLGGPYSIPTYIVMCESGGNYSAVNPSSGAGGAYQIMPSTWAAHGGTGAPQDASKAEQDRIAAEIWADSGPGAWSCA